MTYSPSILNRISTTAFNSRDRATLAAAETLENVALFLNNVNGNVNIRQNLLLNKHIY